MDKSINNLSERLNKLYPDTTNSSNNNYNDGVNYWKGKRIISLNQWFKIEQDYTLETALQYFPDDFLSLVFPFNMDSIDTPKLKEDANKWYSDFEDLMEYRRNPTYGKTKCFNCLLSPHREKAAIYDGINKIIARVLEREHNNKNISYQQTTLYPCSVLNVFECPYKSKGNKEANDEISNFDVDYLFELSEIAFHLELALGEAESMTESNDTIYETNFETNSVREIRTNYYGNPYSSSIDYPLEEMLSKVKRLSIISIRNAQDIYHVLTDRETLDKILEQGLDEENLKHKDLILNFFMNIKDKVRIEDLFITPNYGMVNNNNRQRQYAKCSLCQEFANIYCVNCNNAWLCSDHWRHHRDIGHFC